MTKFFAYLLITSLCLSILIVAFSNVQAAYAESVWNAKRNLSHDVNASEVQRVAVSGSNVYTTWRDTELEKGDADEDSDVFFRASTDGGATWIKAKNLSDDGSSLNPQIAASDGNNVYVVWKSHVSGGEDIFFITSSDNGDTFAEKKNLSGNAGNSDNQQLAVSGSNVYVVWRDNNPGNWDVFFRASTDGGATWGEKNNLSDDSGSSDNPQIAVVGSNVYIVWRDSSAGKNDILFRASTDGGASWSTAKNLSKDGGSWNPQLAVSGSNVYIVWRDNALGSNDVFFMVSTDDGTTFGEKKNLSNDGGSRNPQLAVSGSNVYIVWRDSSAGKNDILFRASTDNGATWSGKKNLSKNAGDSIFPQIVVSGSNKVYIAWVDDSPGNWDVFFRASTDGGASWIAKKNLSNNAGNSDNLQIAVAGSGNVYGTWVDDTFGNLDVIFRDGSIT